MTGRRLLVDTGVIWSFVVADALDLLIEAGGGSIDCVEAVRNELRHNAVRESEPGLMTAANHRNIVWLQLEQELGDTSAAIIDAVETVGSAFVQPSDSNLKHLGEAHMLLMAERLRNRWTMCFEDRDARRFAEGCTR